MNDTQPRVPPIVALHGLRGAAALWVLVYHIGTRAQPIGVAGAFSNGLISHGWFAVDIFFVLSGFVLMRTHGPSFRVLSQAGLARFAAQRALRVYPLATVVLLAIAALVVLDPGFVAYRRHVGAASDFTGWPFVQTLLLATRWLPPFQGNWNEPVWSLSAEIVGYALFPLLARSLLQVRSPRGALLHAVFCFAGLVCAEAIGGRIDRNDIQAWALIRMLYGFCGGIALARLGDLAAVPLQRRAGAMTAAAALLMALACRGGLWAALELPAAALMVLGLASGPSLIASALSTRVALWLGTISFPLYLLHVLPLFWLEYRVVVGGLHGPEVWVAIAVYVVFCLAAAHALHVLVECPTAELARRIGQRRPYRAAALGTQAGAAS